ncbi:MAG: response regulator, partial [Halieaceae bacterium]
YTYETSQAKFFLEIPYWLHKRIEYLALYVSPILFGQTLLAVTRTTSNLTIRFFNLVFASFALLILLIPGEAVMRGTLTPFQYLIAVWGLSMAAIMGWRAYRGSRSARIIVAMFLLLVAALFNDVILDVPLVASGNVLYIVFGLLMFVMALMMAERYTEILKNLESSVAKRTVELTEANRELAVAAETKGNFLANMSHEMRTPMNAILGLTHLGLKTELTDQQRDYFSKVEQSAEGLQGIIDSILDFSKLQDGQLQCVTEPFNLSSSLAGVEHIWKDSVEEAGLTLTVSADAQMPESLLGDGQRLKQVLGIFVSNAIKFTEEGEVRLGAQLLNSTNAAATVRFSVADTGSGIAEDQREKLFEAFSQADNSMTREFGGAGLGLSIAQRLVELMGGQISVDSTLGAGSTFSFELTLPFAETSATADTDEGDLDLTAIRGARVLLVDDSELNLQVAGELLRQAKLYVDTAMDGKEAVDKVNAAAYDCVLMDVQMPVMDGYTATEQIRAKPHFKNLPILAMTANAMPQDRARGAEAGMNDYIPKPVDPDDLYRTLLKWIESGDRDFDEERYSGLTVSTEASAELPDSLPGINIREGMTRVGGNSRLYLDLLADLCRDYADSGQRIENMLAAADDDGARQLAHKLRGIANNLGMTSVGVAAEAIELPLKSGDSVPADALPQLSAALEEAAKSQATLVPLMATGGTVEMDQGEQLLLLVELMQAVTDNNPEALEMVEQLLAAAGESPGAKGLAAAKEALELYDFASAGQHLQTVSL